MPVTPAFDERGKSRLIRSRTPLSGTAATILGRTKAMAMSVVYTVWDGQVVSENRGGVRRDYVPDPLGNTIALVDSNHDITDTYDYWPYGEERVHNGPSTTGLTFLGTLGYFKAFLNVLYVRTRDLRVDLTRWFAVDSSWPFEAAYTYSDCMPGLSVDPSGTASGGGGGGGVVSNCLPWYWSAGCKNLKCSGRIDCAGVTSGWSTSYKQCVVPCGPGRMGFDYTFQIYLPAALALCIIKALKEGAGGFSLMA